jgi:membrane-associated phospholipid phosphatase
MSPTKRKNDERLDALVLETLGLMILLIAVSPSPLTAAAPKVPNSVVVWDRLTTTLGLSHQTPTPFLAHDYALIHVAIFDALLSNANKALPETAIVAGASKAVLMYLFVSNATAISETFNSQLASITGYTSDQIKSAAMTGENVGDAVVAYAETDGSVSAWDGVMPTGQCTWTGSNPVGPVFGFQKTFILTSGKEFQPPPPYACGSQQDLQDVQAVINAHNSLTTEEIAIVHKWADLPPPTIWNNMLNYRFSNHSLSTFDAARASAYLNVGMYDAFVTCWAVKYVYWTARPFQRIPGFVPVIATPNFPSYASGHSMISSAASLIMGHLFPEEATFFIAQAQEAAISRLWGGIHYPQDNNNGFALGQLIGTKVVGDMQGPAHPFVLSRNSTTISEQMTSANLVIPPNAITPALQQLSYGLITVVNTVAIVWLILRVRKIQRIKRTHRGSPR